MSTSPEFDFDVKTIIGRGGFGTVMEVRAKNTQNTYALKQVGLAEASAMREVEIHRLLDHPNIVKFYNAWTSGNSEFK